MAMDNTVTLTGNATRDPELRFTPSGAAVASFGLAVNRRWQNRQSQEWEEEVSFFDVSCWAQLAENVSESVAKGMRVTVTGRLEQQSWEDKSGDKRSKVQVVADDVALSLKWATGEVQRNPARGEGGSGAGRSSGSRSGARRTPDYDPDEEPF